MKRYLVFAYEHYYPEGGFNDLVLATDSFIEALDVANKCVEKLSSRRPNGVIESNGSVDIVDIQLKKQANSFDMFSSWEDIIKL